MTSNKTRCFQVVPVPGVFNRGRWECWDYKEGEDNSETKENDTLASEKNSTSLPPNSSTTTNVNAEAVAIDNKIEQAMDLVKTHLTFAVREQVENLRSRIMELESKVMNLEAENSVLRDHIPTDVLQTLSLQPAPANYRSNNTS